MDEPSGDRLMSRGTPSMRGAHCVERAVELERGQPRAGGVPIFVKPPPTNSRVLSAVIVQTVPILGWNESSAPVCASTAARFWRAVPSTAVKTPPMNSLPSATVSAYTIASLPPVTAGMCSPGIGRPVLTSIAARSRPGSSARSAC